MSANLTPMYHKAERAFRRAVDPKEQLACLEEMYALLPKHKGTDKLQADIKRKLKEVRAELVSLQRGQVSSTRQRIARQGVAQIVVIGAPNAGKSRLVAELTNASPEVAEYPFTTRIATPGMMQIRDVAIQLVDTPPIAVGQLDPELLNLIRRCDLVVLCVDGSDDEGVTGALAVLHELASRSTRLGFETGFFGDGFAELSVRARAVVTRSSDSDARSRWELFAEEAELDVPVIYLEAERAESRDALRDEMFDALDLVRVYTKRPGQVADRSDPFTFPRGATVEDLAGKVHEELRNRVRSARLWGQDSKEGKTVGKDYALEDGDLVELQV